MKYQLKVIKSGSNDFGSWCLGQLSNGIVTYNGIFKIEGDTELLKDLVINVKSVIVYPNKKGNLTIKVIL